MSPPPSPAELAKASRVETSGWIHVHLEGTPREIGIQHGWLLAAEIDDLMRALAHFLWGSTGRDWAFFREAAERMFWPKVDPEYREEIEGIVAGMRARLPRLKYDAIDVTALNAWIELAWYYVPYLDELARKGAGDNKAPGYCSAFIATGSWTEDGGIGAGEGDDERAGQRDEALGPQGPSVRAGFRSQGFLGGAPRVPVAEAVFTGSEGPSVDAILWGRTSATPAKIAA